MGGGSALIKESFALRTLTATVSTGVFTREVITTLLAILASVLAPFVSPSVAHAQCTAGWVPNAGIPFSGVQAANGEIICMLPMPNGDVIVGGYFTSVGGVSGHNRISRYSPSSNTWTPLGSGLSGSVWSLALLNNGDLLAGGTFTSAGGAPANRIARYRFSTNTWSAIGSGSSGGGVGGIPNAGVYAMAKHPSGQVVIGGGFSLIGSGDILSADAPRPNLAVVSADGASFSGVISGLYFSSRTVIEALTVLPNGTIAYGGGFNGLDSNNAISYDGFVGFVAPEYFNGQVSGWVQAAPFSRTSADVKVLLGLPNGDLVAGGYFTSAGGVSNLGYIGRYRPSNDTWSAIGQGADNDVGGLAILPGGDLVVSGRFTSGGGVAARRVARINLSTNTWSFLDAGLTGGTNPVAYAVAPINGGTGVLVGGKFTTAGGLPAVNFARYTFSTPAPQISGHPVSLTRTPSSSAMFSVTLAAGSVTPSFSWRKNGTPINSATNASATTATLVIPSVQPSDVGTYDCVVTAPGGCGSATSNPATLMICNPPVIVAYTNSSAACPGGTAPFSVTAGGDSPLSYQWQVADSGASGGWRDLIAGSNVLPTGRTVCVADQSTSRMLVTTCSGFGAGGSALESFRCRVTNTCGSVTAPFGSLSVCTADFDCDGQTRTPDLFAYLDAWFAQNGNPPPAPPAPNADFNGSNAVDVVDLFSFLDAWFAQNGVCG